MNTLIVIFLCIINFHNSNYRRNLEIENKNLRMEVVKEFYRCIDDNQTDKISQIISHKFIDHDAKNPQTGLEELQALIVALHEGFSDLSHKIEQVYLIDNDKIFVRWKMTGKHTGTFFNIPASEKNIVLYGHDLFKIVDGKIIEQWHIEQLLSLINQISN